MRTSYERPCCAAEIPALKSARPCTRRLSLQTWRTDLSGVGGEAFEQTANRGIDERTHPTMPAIQGWPPHFQ